MAAGYGIALAIQLWRVLPFWDQWEAVKAYRAWAAGALSFLDLVAQHNEHRLPTKLAFLVDFAFFQGRSTFTHSLLLLVQRARGNARARGDTGPHGERADVGGGSWNGLPGGTGPDREPHFAIPFVMGGIRLVRARGLSLDRAACWSHAPWCPCEHRCFGRCLDGARRLRLGQRARSRALVTVMAFVLPVGREARIVLAAAAALSIASYFVGYTVPPYHAAFHASLGSRDGVLQFLYYIAAFLGSVAQHSLKVSFLLGIIGLAVWAAVTFALLSRLRFGGPLDPSAVALLLLATLAIATAAMTALGRAGIGPLQGMSSRYATWSVLFWASRARVRVAARRCRATSRCQDRDVRRRSVALGSELFFRPRLRQSRQGTCRHARCGNRGTARGTHCSGASGPSLS
jgi:hypothetical protein